METITQPCEYSLPSAKSGFHNLTLNSVGTISRYYYIDASMDKNFNEIFKRAQSWADLALKRLSDPNDAEFREVFQNIFKTSVMDNQPMPRSPGFAPSLHADLQPLSVTSHVRRELHSLAYGWTRTDKREEAEVRIHKNAMHRYVQIAPALFHDPVNAMAIIDINWNENLGWMWNKWHAFVIHGRQVDYPGYQNPQRNVIEFTENAQNHWGLLVGVDLYNQHINSVMKGLREHILIHELMHCEAYGLLDFYNERGQTSCWDLVAGLPKGQAYICAESIAILCLAAAVAALQPVGYDKTFKYTVTKDGRIGLHQQGRSGLQFRESF